MEINKIDKLTPVPEIGTSEFIAEYPRENSELGERNVCQIHVHTNHCLCLLFTRNKNKYTFNTINMKFRMHRAV